MTTLRLGLLLAGLSAFLIQTGVAQDGKATPPPPEKQTGVTKDEIKKFLEATLSEDAIIAYIERHPPNPPICCDDITELKRLGAGDEVILALIEAEAPSAEHPDYASAADAEPSTDDYSDSPSTEYYYYPSNPRPYRVYSSPPPVIIVRDRGFGWGRRYDRFYRPRRDRFWAHSQRPLRSTARPVHLPAQAAPQQGVGPLRDSR
jgi:hypothetical protein